MPNKNKNGWTGYRRVVESHKTPDQVKECIRLFSRFPHAYKALKWRLERDCKNMGVAKNNFHLYSQSGNFDYDIPNLLVVYKFDDEKVEIISVSAQEAK